MYNLYVVMFVHKYAHMCIIYICIHNTYNIIYISLCVCVSWQCDLSGGACHDLEGA